MLKPQKYRVQFVDGRTEDVTVDGRDYVFYERESGESSLELVAKGNSFETWYVSAAAAMRRQGMYDGTPEEFFDAVAFVVPVTDSEAVEADPTTPPADSESLS